MVVNTIKVFGKVVVVDVKETLKKEFEGYKSPEKSRIRIKIKFSEWLNELNLVAFNATGNNKVASKRIVFPDAMSEEDFVDLIKMIKSTIKEAEMPQDVYAMQIDV